MMKHARSFVFAFVLSAGSLVAVGCGGTVEQPQTQANAASKAPIGQSTHGMVKMVGEALGEVALRPEQRVELEKLAAATDARHASMGEGKKELMLALADQIEKGSIDKAALQPKIDRIVADVEKSRPEDRAALLKVHALLDAEQRNAFVDALETRFEHHGGKHGKHHGKGAKHADGPKAEAEQGGGEHHAWRGGKHGMMQLAADLKLTDEQKEKIRDVMKNNVKAQAQNHGSFRDFAARREEGKKSLESFRTEKFDAEGLTPPPEKLKEMASAGSTRFVGMAESILPILTPEQRKIAAEKIRGMATSGQHLP